MNVHKYMRQYFMPPQISYDWVKKIISKRYPHGVPWICGMETRH